MMGFNDSKIRSKLMLIMVLTGTCVLFLAMVAMVITEYQRTKSTVVNELESLANVVSWNSAAALAFDDQKSAQLTLASLGEKQSVVAAYLYDVKGEVFSFYIAGQEVNSEAGMGAHCLKPEEVLRVEGNTSRKVNTRKGNLNIVEPVSLYDDHIGTLHIVDDQSELDRMLKSIYLVTVAIFMVALGLIFILSSRLQKIFSDPVHDLIRVMNEVAGGKDYSTRVEKRSRDEFGDLVDVFNGMLEEIEERDGELAKHRQNLERQVSDRTMELSTAVQELKVLTAEAVEAKEAAEAASRAKSEFLATMSHEIRTPMNGVLGMTELLIGSGLEGKQYHFADTIQRSGRSLLGIINDILDFSKIESGKLELDIQDFDARQIIEETAEIMADQAQRKGLELTVDLPLETSLLLKGDSQRIRQVLLNLLGNAVKFTSQGDVSIKMMVLKETSSTLAFRCEVNDTGIGVPPDIQEKIFQAFQQADGSTTRRYGGTGLGLAISSQLLSLMGGTIGVNNAPGGGASFWFELELERQMGAATAKFPERKSLSGINILLVDDNAINREILLTQTATWGMTCKAVDSAEAGLEELTRALAEERPYDGAILDWQMPVVDGIELARRIQTNPELSGLKLAMLSSAGFDDESMRAASVGIDCYMNKPVRQELLFRSLCRMFSTGTVSSFSHPAAPQEKAKKFTGARILLAEDNPMNQEVAQGMLETEGCQVTIVDNGQQAVDIMATNTFDLVMMDCHMPVMDGFTATGFIRVQEMDSGSGLRTPIVALTADVQKGIQDQCLAAGMDDYLSKPFTGDQLHDLLGAWLVPGDRPISRPSSDRPKQAQAESSAPSRGVSGEAILDESVLDQIRHLERQTGRPILSTVIKKFMAGYDNSMGAIQAALENQDGEALFSSAHFMKSGFANLGAMKMSGLCRDLEDLGRQGQMENTQDLWENFESESTLVRNALEQLLEQEIHV